MTNEELLDVIRRCDIRSGIELIPGTAFLIRRRFRRKICGRVTYQQLELIILVKNDIKVGAIYKMVDDIHAILKPQYREQHIMSDFARTGIINKLCPEITSIELCGIHSRQEYEKKKHLAILCQMSVKNAEEIEELLGYRKRVHKRQNKGKCGQICVVS